VSETILDLRNLPMPFVIARLTQEMHRRGGTLVTKAHHESLVTISFQLPIEEDGGIIYYPTGREYHVIKNDTWTMHCHFTIKDVTYS
jgi:hypothetical protein